MTQNMTLPENIRILMFDVIQNDHRLPGLMYELYRHFPRCEHILRWLIKNKIVGEKLFNWVNQDMERSPLAAWSYILGKIEGEKKFKVIYGKDWK